MYSAKQGPQKFLWLLFREDYKASRYLRISLHQNYRANMYEDIFVWPDSEISHSVRQEYDICGI